MGAVLTALSTVFVESASPAGWPCLRRSIMVGPKDPARLVVVKGLAGAKELRLRTRLAKMTASTMMGAWGNARLYR